MEYRSGGTGGPTWFISHPSSPSVTSLISLLSPLSDQQRFSPNNITTSSKGKVMRIIKKITIKEMFWSFNKLFSKKMYGGQSGIFVCCYWLHPSPPPPPPPPTSVRPLILLSQSDLFHSKNIVTVKFRTPGHELHLTIFSSMCWNEWLQFPWTSHKTRN